MTSSPRSTTGLPPLVSGSVLVWRGTLDPPPEVSALLDTALTPEERARADGLRMPAVNRRFRASRGWTRLVLAGYVGTAPGRLVFTRSPTGKPGIEGGPAFNLSHSGDHLLLAMAPEGALGVDVEEGRRLRDLDGLASRVFSTREREDLFQLPAGPAREAAFLRGWTRKEALVKAMGQGLSLPFHLITVDILQSKGSLLRRIDPSVTAGWEGDPAGWNIVDGGIAAPAAGAAAVAWDRPIGSLQVVDLPPDPASAAWMALAREM
ncbi:MAG: 4'-phosphopantetheinyl transferase superfamily protein [Gemmatimonadales bacterium]|nr:MAG: 4'-phosphopantetheinyl transferase superfamily protein [Gemmatimonadales bacterium]